MEDIKVNDYIRTNFGRIGKIIAITNDYIFTDTEANCIAFKYCNHFFKETFNQVVKKHSKNIIDLIEENDIGIMSYGGIIFRKFITKDDIVELKVGNYKLLEIVTKELFSSVKYEVER